MATPKLRPSLRHPSFTYSIFTLLTFILVITLAPIHADGETVLHFPLEKRHPKPMRPNSHHGLPRYVRIHEPTPAPRNTLHALIRRLTTSTTHASSTMTDVELFGGMVAVGEYYVKVKIGGQTLRVQIDTGSATLAVPLKQCTHCKRGDMRYAVEDSTTGIAEYISCGHEECGANTCSFDCGKCSSTQACCAKSNSSSCAFHLSFGDGSGAKGMLVRDEFEWGGIKFPVTFGGIASDSDDFERSEVDGILGLAYPSLACNPSCVTPTFDAMRKANSGMRDVFSICITGDSGLITLGGYNPVVSSKSQSDMTWVPLQLSSPPTFYSIPLKGDLKMNGNALKLPDFSRAIVDSGTTLIVFSKATFRKVKDHFMKNHCDVPGLCDEDTWFKAAHCTRLKDKDLLKLPTMTFPLDGFNLELGPKDYMINYASKGPEFWCVGMMSLDAMSGAVDVILGNVVMNKYVTVYDRENVKVGFTLSDTSCGADVKNAPTMPGAGPGSEDGGGEGEGEDDGGTTTGQGGAGAGGGSDEDATPKGGSQPSPADMAACAVGTNCTTCARVQAVSCRWDAGEGRCVPGRGSSWMCTLDNVESNLAIVIGGAVAGVVVAIVVVAIVVHGYRKRREAELDDAVDDSEAQQPLTPHAQQGVAPEVDTREAFAIDDEP